MKKTVPTLASVSLIVTALAGTIFADWTFKPDHHHKGKVMDIEARMAKMKSELQLTDTQVTEIKGILEKYAPTRQKRDVPPPPPPERVETIREMEIKIKAVLNPDQQEKYEKFKASLKSKNKAEMQARVLEKMKTELRLTDEQSKRVAKVLDDFQNEMISIMNGDPKLSEIREKSKAAREKRESELKQILTPEQWGHLQTIKAQRPPVGDAELPEMPHA